MDTRTTGTPEEATGTPDPDATGTPAKDDGSASGSEVGSALTAGGSDAGSTEDYKSLWEKAERERLRLLNERSAVEQERRDLAAERARGSSPPTSDPHAAQQRFDQMIRNLNVMAQSEDEGVRTLAQAQLALLENGRQNAAEMGFQQALLRVDSEIRTEVEALVRGQKADIATAITLVQLQRSQANGENQRAQTAERDLAAKVKKDTAPSTGAANSGPARKHTTMTFAEREALRQRATASEWRAHMADVDEGRVKLTP